MKIAVEFQPISASLIILEEPTVLTELLAFCQVHRVQSATFTAHSNLYKLVTLLSLAIASLKLEGTCQYVTLLQPIDILDFIPAPTTQALQSANLENLRISNIKSYKNEIVESSSSETQIEISNYPS